MMRSLIAAAITLGMLGVVAWLLYRLDRWLTETMPSHAGPDLDDPSEVDMEAVTFSDDFLDSMSAHMTPAQRAAFANDPALSLYVAARIPALEAFLAEVPEQRRGDES